jgi:hypothetical protein
MVWQKGSAVIMAEFKNTKLQELSSNLFSIPLLPMLLNEKQSLHL